MARTAIAVLQPVWDCHWSRPGHRLTGVDDDVQPESRWVCVREGARRDLADGECETCSDWTLEDALIAPAVATAAAAPRVYAPPLLWASRAVLAVIAAWMFVIGFSLLTRPAAVPVTVLFWLAGAAVVAVALLWQPTVEPEAQEPVRRSVHTVH
jgi:hypothetical protein